MCFAIAVDASGSPNAYAAERAARCSPAGASSIRPTAAAHDLALGAHTPKPAASTSFGLRASCPGSLDVRTIGQPHAALSAMVFGPALPTTTDAAATARPSVQHTDLCTLAENQPRTGVTPSVHPLAGVETDPLLHCLVHLREPARRRCIQLRREYLEQLVGQREKHASRRAYQAATKKRPLRTLL